MTLSMPVPVTLFFLGFFSTHMYLKKKQKREKTGVSVRFDLSSVHSTKLLILKNESFSHTFQSGILNVMFILNPYPFWYTAYHQPVWLNPCWASLPWNPCCCGRFIYISTFVNCKGRGRKMEKWKLKRP